MNGKPLPIAKPKFEFAPTGNLLASPWKFQKHGQSGIEVSDLFPQIGSCIDDICVIRSMNGGNQVSHGPALLEHQHRRRRLQPPQPGGVDALRPGDREPEPARLPQPQPVALSRRGAELRLGVPAGELSRERASATAARPFKEARLSNLTPGDDPRLAAAAARPARATRIAQHLERVGRRPAPGSPHRRVRDGLPDAGRGPGGDGPRPRDRRRRRLSTASARSRPTSTAGSACWPGAVSRPACGSCRSTYSYPAELLGRARRPAQQPLEQCQEGRPADRRPADGPEGARPARRHAGDLRHRVRPHAGGAGDRRPRPPSARLQRSGWPAAASAAG